MSLKGKKSAFPTMGQSLEILLAPANLLIHSPPRCTSALAAARRQPLACLPTAVRAGASLSARSSVSRGDARDREPAGQEGGVAVPGGCSEGSSGHGRRWL